MNTLSRLQHWYQQQCDGEWEHHHGISIESCDNPGWWLKVDLRGTALLDKPYSAISENVGKDGFQRTGNWVACRREGDNWEGAGDETKLETIIETFLNWAEAIQSDVPESHAT